MNTRTKIFGAVIGLAMFSLACGSSTPAAVSISKGTSVTSAEVSTVAPQKLAHVGDTVTAGNYVVTLKQIDRTSSPDSEGKVMVSADILIESKGEGVSANPLYVSLKDGEGFKYDQAFMSGKEPSLGSQNDITPGDKVRGWVSFKIPPTAKGLVLRYEPLSFVSKVMIAFALD